MRPGWRLTWELDELGPDGRVVDYASLLDHRWLIVLLLTDAGDIQVYVRSGSDPPRRRTVSLSKLCGQPVSARVVCVGPEAGFAVVGLCDGDLLVVPMRILLDQPFSSGRWFASTQCARIYVDISADIDEVLRVPTAIRCFASRHSERPIVAMSNKAGQILLVDLSTRSLAVELRAPQTLHDVHVCRAEDGTQLLATGFTGAQWLIPLETGEESVRAVLAKLVPSDLRQLDPPTSVLVPQEGGGVAVLDTRENTVSMYEQIGMVGAGAARSRWKVPSDTWLFHCTPRAMFAAGGAGEGGGGEGEGELRAAVHFGLPTPCPLEWRGVSEGDAGQWKLLGFVAAPGSTAVRLDEVLAVNERGIVKLQPDANGSIDAFAADYLLHVDEFAALTVSQLGKAVGGGAVQLATRVLPHLLGKRRVGVEARRLSPNQLQRVLLLAKLAKTEMDDLIALFSAAGAADQLLPEVLRRCSFEPSLCARAVELFIRRAAEGDEATVDRVDAELSTFIQQHPGVTAGATDCVPLGLWRAAAVLLHRADEGHTTAADWLVTEGVKRWEGKEGGGGGDGEKRGRERTQLVSLALSIRWPLVPPATVPLLVKCILKWQSSLRQPSLSRQCVRVAREWRDRFPHESTLLHIVSAMHVLAATKTAGAQADCLPPARRIACGLNSSLAIDADGKVWRWGDARGMRVAAGVREIKHDDLRSPAASRHHKSDVLFNSPACSPRKSVNQQLQGDKADLLRRPVELPAKTRPHAVHAGTEHTMIVSTDGRVWTYGQNRFGQCGVGHRQPIEHPVPVPLPFSSLRWISCGAFHTAVIDDKGALWTWGWSVWGQLGGGMRRSQTDALRACKVRVGEPLVQVVCGRAHTVVLAESGIVYAAGTGVYGQLGNSGEVKKQFEFRPVGEGVLGKVVRIAGGFYHNVAICEDGRIFEWGKNPQELKMKMFVMRRMRNAAAGVGGVVVGGKKKEEEGKGDENSQAEEGKRPALPPLPIEIPKDHMGIFEVPHLLDGPVVDVACGLSHSCVITQQGSMYTWGKSLEHQLGHGSKTERVEPHQVFEPEARWTQVAAGGNHSLALSSSSLSSPSSPSSPCTVFSWGRNDAHQCAQQERKGEPASPRKYFFKSKDGAARRCIQLADDTSFVTRPAMVEGVVCAGGGTGISPSTSSSLDRSELVDVVRSAEPRALLAASAEMTGDRGTSISSLPLASVHLLAGSVRDAVDVLAAVQDAIENVEEAEPDCALWQLSSAIWSCVANEEECHALPMLQHAFAKLPLAKAQLASRQLRHLCPPVWKEEGVLERFSSLDRLDQLEQWIPAPTAVNKVHIPSATVSQMSGKVRVWAGCGHVEADGAGAVGGGAGGQKTCTRCAAEWRDKARDVLSLAR